MSSRAALWIGVISLWAGALAAQDSAARLSRMETRLDSMQSAGVRRTAEIALNSVTDTVVAGGLRIATSAAYRSMAQEAANEAWEGLALQFGPSIAARATIPVLSFGLAGGVVPRDPDIRQLAHGFEISASEAVWRTEGGEVLRWLRGNVPAVRVSQTDLADLATELLRTPARPNRACYTGSVGACAAALEVRLGADTLGEWYDQDTWPRLAESLDMELTRPEIIARERCRNERDLSACRSVLVAERVRPPVGSLGRQFLLQLALDTGGPSAFERFSASAGSSLEDRLVAAAGVPMDTLLTRWSRSVRAAAPRGPARPESELLLAFAASACLLALALGGSRWR